MTSETRVLISLSDIEGIEFHCRRCGAHVLYPLMKYDRQPAMDCTNCTEHWFTWKGDKDDDFALVSQLISLLKMVSSKKSINADVLLQITSSTSQKSEQRQ